MGPGDIIIINNIEPHYLEAYDEGMHQPVIIFDPSLVWSHTGLPFDYDYLKPFFERGTDFSNRLDTGNPSAVQVMEHLTAIEQEYTEKSEGYQLMIKARLLILLTILIRHFRDKDKASFNTSANNKRMHLVKIEEVLKYIEQNFCRDIKLEEAASMIYVTPQYFSAFFKKITGVNFVDYLNNVRINHAVRLLKETDKKITHIAMECGFNSTNNFNSAFKKHTGKTPSQFR
jgi:AraC-like DNA-binding protein